MFHFYQSILSGIIVSLFTFGTTSVVQVIGGTLGMVPGMPMEWLSYVSLGLHFIGQALILVLVYGGVCAFLGKMKDIPGIGRLARMQMR
jgi:hypothetical protein